MELNGTITENRVDLGGTITPKKTLAGALAPTGGGGSAVVTRGTGANSIIGVNSINPNTASGEEAIALGGGNQSSSDGGISIGTNNLVSGKNAIAIGSKIRTADPNTASGTCSTAIGASCEASGTYAIAMGNQSKAQANSAVAVGYHAEATAAAAFSAGFIAKSSGQAAGAIGLQPVASGTAAMAFGQETEAEATASTALGCGTDATGARSLVAGSYNEADTEAADATTGQRKYVVIVGNGTADDARSNAATLDWDGNAVFAGKATVGAAPTADMDVATKKYVDDNAGGTSDYTDLSNKPQINGNTLTGNKTAANLGLASASDLATKITAPSSPATGAFLVWNGSAWVAQTLTAWQGGNY